MRGWGQHSIKYSQVQPGATVPGGGTPQVLTSTVGTPQFRRTATQQPTDRPSYLRDGVRVGRDQAWRGLSADGVEELGDDLRRVSTGGGASTGGWEYCMVLWSTAWYY